MKNRKNSKKRTSSMNTRKREVSKRSNPQNKKTIRVKPVSKIRYFPTYLFYGTSGTGKTTFAATWPGKKLFVDLADEGLESIKNVKNCYVTETEDWQDLEDIYWYLKKNPNEYDGVIIDTVTQMQQRAVEKILIDKKKPTENAGDWGSMTKGDWGDVASLMKSWITNFRDLPMEVIFLAQQRVFNLNDDDEETLLAPEVSCRLSPAVRAHMEAEVQVVAQTTLQQREVTKFKKVPGKKKKIKDVVEEINYCLRLGPDPVYMTKVRKPKEVILPQFIIDPTYEDLIEIMNGE